MILKKIILALVTATNVFGYIDEPCFLETFNEEGVCVNASECTMYNNQEGSVKIIQGLCPNDPADVVCCIKDVTKLTSGQTLYKTGRCMNISQCSPNNYATYSYQCPGSFSGVKLCVPRLPQPPRATVHEIIDLSELSVVEDYDTVVENIDGVILRSGYRDYSSGALVMDAKLEDHYNGFVGKTNIGYYFYTQAITTDEAEEEASYVVNTLLNGKIVDFPIFLDVEYSGAPMRGGRADRLTYANRTECIVSFVNKVQDLGYRAGVFAFDNWFRLNFDYNQIADAGASIWVGKYSNGSPITDPSDAWKYTPFGSVPGINGEVNKTRVYTDITTWDKYISYEIIDISEFNIVEDYDTVVENIDGVILRTGYRGYGSAGQLVKDAKFDEHYNGFAGKTKIGYYFYSQAITIEEAEEEASYVVNTLLNGKVIDFPIYWDTEESSGRADYISRNERTTCAIAFISKIQALGYRAGVYANEFWFRDDLDFDRIVNSGASIWVARYGDIEPSTSQYDAWQYTETGSIPGISGDVDRSHVYSNIAGW